MIHRGFSYRWALTPVVTILALGLGAMFVRGDLFMPATTLSAPHQSEAFSREFKLRAAVAAPSASHCATCHEPWRGARDRKCLTCHESQQQRLKPHEKLALACSTCHMEHRGQSVQLAKVDDHTCEAVGCHPRHHQPQSPATEMKRTITRVGTCIECHNEHAHRDWKPANSLRGEQ